jgi:hypothetical protein
VCVDCALAGVEAHALGMPASGGAGLGTHRADWVRLIRGAEDWEARRLRVSSQRTYAGGLADFTDFCHARGVAPLPAAPELLRGYIYHCTHDRGLDAGTVSGRLSAVSDWHRRQSSALTRVGRAPLPNAVREAPVADVMAVVRRLAKTGRRGRLGLSKTEFAAILRAGFDLSCASGHHRRLALVISTLGCLRRRAAVHLRVCYEVDASGQLVFLPTSEVYIARDLDIGGEYIGLRVLVDKNVDSRIDANAYIPECVGSLGVRPVDLLRDYLLRFRPPSRGYLLSAPRSRALGPATFNAGAYTCLGSAYRAAFLRAFPDATGRTTDISRVSSHSGRKSLSQWLWDAYSSQRLIADVGHWRCRKDAVQIYFHTSRATILRCIAGL